MLLWKPTLPDRHQGLCELVDQVISTICGSRGGSDTIHEHVSITDERLKLKWCSIFPLCASIFLFLFTKRKRLEEKCSINNSVLYNSMFL